MQRRRGLKFPTAVPDQPAGVALTDNFTEIGDRIPKCNYTATTDPTPTDDSESGGVGHGYWPGSMWHNTATGRVFRCLDGTPLSAIWTLLVASADGDDAATPFVFAKRNNLGGCSFSYIHLNAQDADGFEGIEIGTANIYQYSSGDGSIYITPGLAVIGGIQFSGQIFGDGSQLSGIVTSVNGHTDAVGLTTTDITEGTNKYYTSAHAVTDGFAKLASPIFTGGVTLTDGIDLTIGATTGSKIGQSGSKIGFYGTTPAVRASSTTDLRQALITIGLIPTGGASPLNLNGGIITAVGSGLTGIPESGVTNLTADLAAKASTTNPTLAGVTITDATDVVIGTTTGTKLGQSTSKIGFFGVTPITRPTSTTDLRQALINLGLYTTGGATPLNLNGGTLTAADAVLSGEVQVNGLLKSNSGLALGSTTHPAATTYTPGSVIGHFPLYDPADNSVIGLIPIYDTMT